MARERRPDDRQQRKQAVDKVHAEMTRMVNSRGFKKALEDLDENPEAARQDPRGFLEQRGVDLPDDAEVSLVDRPGSACWCYRVCVLWWCWDVCVCVD